MDVVLDSMRMSEGLTVPTLRANARPDALPAPAPAPLRAVPLAPPVAPRIIRTIPLPPELRRGRPPARSGAGGVARALLALMAASILTASYAALAGALPVSRAVLARDARHAPVVETVAPAEAPVAAPAEAESAAPPASALPAPQPPTAARRHLDAPPPYDPSHHSTTGGAIDEIQAVLAGADDAVVVLEITADPDEAIYVGGRLVGWGSRLELTVRPGSYAVVGRQDGEERSQLVDVSRDRRTVVGVAIFTR